MQILHCLARRFFSLRTQLALPQKEGEHLTLRSCVESSAASSDFRAVLVFAGGTPAVPSQ